MRFSTFGIFQQSSPPRTLIHRLKLFRIWLRIRGDNRLESSQIDNNQISAWSPLTPVLPGCMTPLKSFSRGQWPRRNGITGLLTPVKFEYCRFIRRIPGTRSYAKRLLAVNQGPRWSWLMKNGGGSPYKWLTWRWSFNNLKLFNPEKVNGV
jgi:hypothetical protein